MSILAQRAEEYLSLGWSIIPVSPAGKKPLVPWSEFSTRCPSLQEVRGWWKKWPDANVGLVTGKVSAIVVADIDTIRGADPKDLFKEYPTSMISRTGSGGYHLFYKYPDTSTYVQNRVGKDGLDVRGDGGYVVLPPSSHKSGKLYKWLREGDPGECPSWIAEPKEAQERRHRSQPKHQWVAELLSGLGEGGRNDAASRLAGYFLSKEIPIDIASAMLSSWNQRNDPPLPSPELTRTLDSVYKYKNKAAVSTFQLQSAHEFMRQYGDEDVKWAIDGWMPSGSVVFAIAPPGSYKTWMTFDLAISIASGKKFLGEYTVNETGPVIIIQQEDPHSDIATRTGLIMSSRFSLLDKFDENPDEYQQQLPPDLPIFFHKEKELKFNDQKVMQGLAKAIDDVQAKLVIVDPLYSASSTDDYMARAAESMMPLKKIRDKTGCNFLISHHTNKAGGESAQRERVWGSQFLNAFMETGWQIRKQAEDSVSIQRHFKAASPQPSLQITWDISTNYPFKYSVDSTETEESTKGLLEVIEDNGPINATQLALALGIHRSSASRKLKRELGKGTIIKNDDGSYETFSTDM